MFANLHLHSIYSDGVQTPDELCRKAKALGYGAISLPELHTLGLDGAEWQHPDIDEHDSAAVVGFAREHDFYLTGGTDHTGELANDMERDPTRQPKGYLHPLGAHVEHGATKEQFEALRSRIYG